MSDDPFHQQVCVTIEFDKTHTAGELNRKLKGLGATLHYDVYSFDRAEKGPIWQSQSLAYVDTFKDEQVVDAQESVDTLKLEYPLATLTSDYIEKFAELMTKVAQAFNTTPLLNGEPITANGFIEHCDELVTDLMETWGEEPGSEVLVIMMMS